MASEVFYKGRKYRVLGSRINNAKNTMGQKYINTKTGRIPLSQLPDKNDDNGKNKKIKPTAVEPLVTNYAE